MAKPSKKHHFVPQTLLKRFSFNEGIYVYDKKRSIGWISSLLNAGSEKNFNSVLINGLRTNFEAIFDKWDIKLGLIIQKLTEERSLDTLTKQELFTIEQMVVLQYLRAKISRTTLNHIQERRSEIIYGSKINEFDVPDKFSDEEIKLLSLNGLTNIEEGSKMLNDKNLMLFTAEPGMSFLISDNPIVFHNSFPYGKIGFNMKGVEIYYPISRNLVIGFWCNSIFENWKMERPDDIDRINWFKNSKIPINFGVQNTELLNRLQISSSSRFVYSDKDESKFISDFLNKYPVYKETNSRVIVGDIGEWSQRNKSMPDGEYLVIWTRTNHYMIEIELQADSINISFYTKDYDKLKIIEKDYPIENAEVYRNGQLLKAITQAVFYNLDFTGVEPNVISYADRSKEFLFKDILQTPNAEMPLRIDDV